MTIEWDCKTQGCKVIQEVPDWAMLDGCFGDTRVSPMDIDGIVRQNGKCLFFEKKHPQAGLKDAFIWTVDALVNQGNSFIVFWCIKPDGSDITYMRVWGIPGYSSKLKVEASLSDVREATKTWWKIVYEKS